MFKKNYFIKLSILLIGVSLVLYCRVLAEEKDEEAWRPKISVIPAVPVTGDRLKVKLLNQVPTGIELKYLWKVNGKIVQDSRIPLLNYDIKRGDKIEVIVRSFFEELDSSVIPVSKILFVQNAAPILSIGKEEMQGSVYTAHLLVKDPEGDSVKLTLKNGPSGMIVDNVTDLLYWKIPEGTSGVFPIIVVAEDDKGGKTVLSYSIKIDWAKRN